MKKLYLLLLAALLCTNFSFGAQKKVAFVHEKGYNSSKASSYGLPTGGYDTSCDPVYAALVANFDVTPIETTASTEVDYDDLRTYDCVVISEALTGNKTCSNNLVKLVGTVPVVSMKTFNYTNGRWSWAAPSNPGTKTGDIVVEAGFETHALFQGLTQNSDGSFTLYDPSVTISSNRIQGFAQSAIIAGSLLDAEQDKLYAKASGTDYFCIHEMANAEGGKKYVLVGMSSDNIPAVNANGQQIIVNAVNYVTDDAPAPEQDLNIAYLYDSTYTTYCGIDNDPIFNNTKLIEQNTTAINIAKFTAADTDTLEALQNFDLVVISEAMGSGQKFAIACKQLINRVPILNFKSFIYKKGCWAVGAGVNPTSKAANDGGIATIAVPEIFREEALFENIEFESDSLITLFVNYDPETVKKNLVQGYTNNAGGMFESDDVLAKVYNGTTAYNAIHRHGAKNMYMLLPISSDAMFIEDENNLSESCLQLINNAVDIVAKTKSKVTPCVAPTVSQVNGDGLTTITLATSTADASIYYTIDGTEPTEKSTLYSAPFDVTADSTTVKAIAAKQGFDVSSVTSALVRVYVKPSAPEISAEKAEGQTTVTITADAGVTIYYNYVGSSEIAKSAVYSSPLLITRPMTLTAFAYAGAVASDAVSLEVQVQGFDPSKVRDHEFARFDANADDWYWETSGGSSKVAYYMGKKAMSMYTSIDTIISGTDTTIIKNEREPMVWYARNDSANTYDNGWKVMTMGQLVQWESTAPQMVVGKAGDAAYNCDKPEDLLVPATNGHITLTSLYSGESYNAAIQSTKKFQGPFDIVSCIGNNNSDGASLKLELAVSEDGETWIPLDTVGVSYYKRFWTTCRSAYNEDKEVYVRAMQCGGGTKLAVYDLILLNQESSLELGDINGDGDVNVGDMTGLVNIILDIPTEGLHEEVADVNEDGKINVGDCVALTNRILGTSNVVSLNADGISARVFADDFSLAAGESFDMAINFAGAENIAAMQMDITLPAGLTFESARLAGSSHSLATSVLSNGNIRVLGYSSENAMIDASSLIVTVRANASAAGMGRVELGNILVSGSNAAVTGLDAAYATVTFSVQSGLESVMNEESREVYNILGQKVNDGNLRSGVYVINGKKTVVR